MNHYRYRKVTPKMKEEMEKLRNLGLSYEKIAKLLDIHTNSVQYHLNPIQREKTIARANKYNKTLTKEQKQIKSKKHREYTTKYNHERYQGDNKFRKRFIELVTKSFKNRQKIWKKEGLCLTCGRKREDKLFSTCERCRKRGRNKSNDKKR